MPEYDTGMHICELCPVRCTLCGLVLTSYDSAFAHVRDKHPEVPD